MIYQLNRIEPGIDFMRSADRILAPLQGKYFDIDESHFFGTVQNICFLMNTTKFCSISPRGHLTSETVFQTLISRFDRGPSYLKFFEEL